MQNCKPRNAPIIKGDRFNKEQCAKMQLKCMLVYKRVDKLEIMGYTYLDLVGCLDDKKSTSRYVFMMVGVQYPRRVRNKLLLLLLDFAFVESIARPLRNDKASSGSKHLELKYLTIKDLVKDGSIMVEHIDTDSMLADSLTKELRPIVFERHVESIDIVSSFD
ncbi:hypothetical protein CR513_37800, partial [Mucuna pruriens]